MTNQALIQSPAPAVKKSARAKALAVPQYLRDAEKFTSPGDVEQAVTRYLSALGAAGLCVQALRGMVGSTDLEVVKEYLLPHVGRYYGVPTRTTGTGRIILMAPPKEDADRFRAYETARKRLTRLAEEVCEVAEAKAPEALPEASEGAETKEEVAPSTELINAMLALIEAHQVGKKTASKALAKAFSALKGAATAALK